jgi:hypothetical protein
LALQISYTDPTSGQQAPQGYVRIDDSSSQLAAGKVSVEVSLYFNKAARDAGLAPIHSYPTFLLTPTEQGADNPNFVTALRAQLQAGAVHAPRDAFVASLYLVLKSRPEFALAVDV